MKKIFFFFVFLYLHFYAYSQCSPFSTCLNGSSGQAVDFTVTDLNGNSHNLYSYLNSNKIVVLEYLSVTCGHCINHAPYIEDFYEAWGPSGNDLVELIGLEINVTTNDVIRIFIKNLNYQNLI